MLPGYPASPGPGCLPRPGAGPQGTPGLAGERTRRAGAGERAKASSQPAPGERAQRASETPLDLLRERADRSRSLLPARVRCGDPSPGPCRGGPALSSLRRSSRAPAALGAQGRPAGHARAGRELYKWSQVCTVCAASFHPRTTPTVGRSKPVCACGFIVTAPWRFTAWAHPRLLLSGIHTHAWGVSRLPTGCISARRARPVLPPGECLLPAADLRVSCSPTPHGGADHTPVCWGCPRRPVPGALLQGEAGGGGSSPRWRPEEAEQQTLRGVRRRHVNCASGRRRQCPPLRPRQDVPTQTPCNGHLAI